MQNSDVKRTPGPLAEFAAKKRLERAAPDLLSALKAMLKAYEQLMPGLAHIAVKDYANINEAPILAKRQSVWQTATKGERDHDGNATGLQV